MRTAALRVWWFLSAEIYDFFWYLFFPGFTSFHNFFHPFYVSFFPALAKILSIQSAFF